MPPEAISWLLYLQGLVEYQSVRPGLKGHVKRFINSGVLGVNETHSNDIYEHAMSPNFAIALVNASWELMPGLPHPRGLTGCEFLASYEMKGLLNIDLCNLDEYTSIRFFCPKACRCAGAHSMSECPAACVMATDL